MLTAIAAQAAAYGIPLLIKGGILAVGYIAGWFHHKAKVKAAGFIAGTK